MTQLNQTILYILLIFDTYSCIIKLDILNLTIIKQAITMHKAIDKAK